MWGVAECRVLAEEYKESAILLKDRITLLSAEQKNDDIKIRINMLKTMYRETTEIQKELKNYYDKKWYRSPKYTQNR